MAKLEIAEKGDCLSHAHVSVHLKAHIRYWPPGIYNSHEIFRDNI